MRIQYVLSVLLYVLLGALEPAAPAPCGTDDADAVRCGGVALHRPGDMRESIITSLDMVVVTEMADHHSSERFSGAGHAGSHSAASRSAAMRQPARLPGCAFHPRPKDYYLYALGRIVI